MRAPVLTLTQIPSWVNTASGSLTDFKVVLIIIKRNFYNISCFKYFLTHTQWNYQLLFLLKVHRKLDFFLGLTIAYRGHTIFHTDIRIHLYQLDREFSSYLKVGCILIKIGNQWFNRRNLVTIYTRPNSQIYTIF